MSGYYYFYFYFFGMYCSRFSETDFKYSFLYIISCNLVCCNPFTKTEDETEDEEQHNHDDGHDTDHGEHSE